LFTFAPCQLRTGLRLILRQTILGVKTQRVSLQIPSDKTSLIIARDLLLIACYTGMAYIDAISVTQDNLSYDEQGSLWLKYKRKKTMVSTNRPGVQAVVKLIPEAIELFDKYKDAGLPTLLTREQALSALTINVAKQMFIENERGSISVGKYADFLLVDKDVLTCPVTEIHTAKPEATYFEGKKVFPLLNLDE